jgi:hypothetical protein
LRGRMNNLIVREMVTSMRLDNLTSTTLASNKSLSHF